MYPKLDPLGHSVYIMECADGTYYTGMCTDIEEELKLVANQDIRYFTDPVRFPVKVVFLESQLPFKDAYYKRRALHKTDKKYKTRLIETHKWPASKIMKSVIFKEVGKIIQGIPLTRLVVQKQNAI